MWKIVVWVSCCFLWVHWTTCAECWVWKMVDSDFRLIDLPNGNNVKGGDPECLASAACNARFYVRGLRTAIAFMCGHDQATGSTVSEDTIAVICSLSGSILYSSFIAVCISLLMEMDAERVRYMGQVERLNHYMGRRNVPMNLRQRVREYMELTWINSGGTDDYEVLAFVSRSLRRELAMHNAAKLIAGVPFLNAGKEGFVSSVSQMLRPEAFMSGDDIMIRGEIGQEMFLLERGIVDIIDSDEQTIVASLGPGAWFGEIALQHKTLRTATIRAHTDGNLFVLHRDDFQKLVPYFPQVAEELQIANERILREIARHKSAQGGGEASTQHGHDSDANALNSEVGSGEDGEDEAALHLTGSFVPGAPQAAGCAGFGGEVGASDAGAGTGQKNKYREADASEGEDLRVTEPARAEGEGGQGRLPQQQQQQSPSSAAVSNKASTNKRESDGLADKGDDQGSQRLSDAVSPELAFAGFDGELVHDKSALSQEAP